MKYLDYAEEAGITLGAFDEVKEELDLVLKFLGDVEDEKDIRKKYIEQVEVALESLADWTSAVQGLLLEIQDR